MYGNHLTAKTMTLAALGAAATMSLAAATQGSVLENPTLSQGPTAIDPVSANDEEIDDKAREGTVSEAVLEANPNFYVNQDFTGFESLKSGGGPNYISFTGANDSKYYDVRFTLNYTVAPGYGGPNDAIDSVGAEHTGNSTTSGSSAVQLGRNAGANRGPTEYNIEIDFGSYDEGSDTFTTLSSGQGLDAASLTIARMKSSHLFEITFMDAEGNTLSDQSFGSTFSSDETDTNPGDLAGVDGFFSYSDTGSGKVARIQVNEAARSNRGSGLDDLGFTAISVPEPASLALVGLGGLALLGRRQRHR